MSLAVTLVAADASTLPAAIEVAEITIARMGMTTGTPDLLGPNAADLAVASDLRDLVRERLEAALEGRATDVCVQPSEGRRKRLLIADMDSTIIGCECIDELADFAGVKDQVAGITERAMRGELAFEGALRERVAMLKGLGLDKLQACYDQRVRLNPGAETLVKTMAAHGARCVLVSGGFTFFTSRVMAAAGFHANRANTLGDDGAVLTGLVGEPILGREAKLTALREETAALGLTPAEALAVGDGANDLAMIEVAGLGVAYRAKPVVAEKAHAKVDHADLTALLYFQGYRAEDFRGTASVNRR
jgi:phosphoserine phosphatase